MFGISGSTWTLIGVSLTVAGTLFAWYGTHLLNSEDSAKDAELRSISTKNVQLSETIADQALRIEAWATGGGSIFFIQFDDLDTNTPIAHLKVKGEYGVRDIHIEIFDTTDVPLGTGEYEIANSPRVLSTDLSFLRENSRRALSGTALNSLPRRERYRFFVYADAVNGVFQQVIVAWKEADVWKQSFVVWKYDPISGDRHEVFRSDDDSDEIKASPTLF